MLLLLGQLHRKSYKWGVGTASTTSEIGYIEHQEACNQTSFLQWIYRYTAFKDRAFKEAHARPKIYPYECVKTSSGTHTHCCIHMHMHIIYSALVHYLLIWMPVLVCNSPSFVCVCVCLPFRPVPSTGKTGVRQVPKKYTNTDSCTPSRRHC